jgi:F-type H+-transporting ATPase subunit delta
MLDLARSDGALAVTGEELGRALAVFEEPRLQPLLLSPAIDTRVRLETTRAVASALALSRPVANLMALLAERDRLTILPDLVRWYEELLDEEVGRARVSIRSAAPLDASEKGELLALARRLTGREDVSASTEVEPDLLGGVVLDIRGTVYDGSVRTQLARLAREMAEGGA